MEDNLFLGARSSIFVSTGCLLLFAILAVVSAIFSDYSLAAKINELLHEYGACIVGRMGMPYPQGGVYIINVTDTTVKTKEELEEITDSTVLAYINDQEGGKR